MPVPLQMCQFQFYDILNGIKTRQYNYKWNIKFQFYDILNGIKTNFEVQDF